MIEVVDVLEVVVRVVAVALVELRVVVVRGLVVDVTEEEDDVVVDDDDDDDDDVDGVVAIAVCEALLNTNAKIVPENLNAPTPLLRIRCPTWKTQSPSSWSQSGMAPLPSVTKSATTGVPASTVIEIWLPPLFSTTVCRRPSANETPGNLTDFNPCTGLM